MSTPIIDPSTLTEEQREAIKDEYDLNVEWEDRSNGEVEKHWYSGRNLTLLWLFGENFFKKENDMKEHYCTYEQAVALKRLGFDWDVRGYYTHDDNFQKAREVTALNHNDTKKFKGLYSAPRLDQAAEWLREVKRWHIQVRINGVRSAYWWEIWSTMPNGPVYGTPDDETFRRGQYESYEQALSAGIDKALDLLGKEVGE